MFLLAEWIDLAHRKGWDVLLDAAAFVPTNALDLGLWRPDFVDVSFYKMFGLPTGVGALLVRKEKLPLLRRKAFFGGNVEYAAPLPLPSEIWNSVRAHPAQPFER